MIMTWSGGTTIRTFSARIKETQTAMKIPNSIISDARPIFIVNVAAAKRLSGL